MKKEYKHLKVPCLIYSRVVGYYAPIENFNAGKVQEFRDRINYKIPEDFNSGYNKQTTQQDFKETL